MAVEGLKAAADTTKQVIIMSSAILALTITFAKEFTPTGADHLQVPCAMKWAWALFFAAIFCGLYTLMAITGTLDRDDRKQPHDGAGGLNIQMGAIPMVLSFLGAILATVIAAFDLAGG